MLLCGDLARATRGAGTRGHGLSSWVGLPPSRVGVGCIHSASAREGRQALVSAIKCKGNSAPAAMGAVLEFRLCQSAKVSGTCWRACAGRSRRGVGLRVYHTLAAHANANAATAELPPAGQSLRANIGGRAITKISTVGISSVFVQAPPALADSSNVATITRRSTMPTLQVRMLLWEGLQVGNECRTWACSSRHDATGDERWQPLHHRPARSPRALAARPGSLRCHRRRSAARPPEAHLLAARPGLRCHRHRIAARNPSVPEAHSLVAARPGSLVGPGVPRAARYQTRATPWRRFGLAARPRKAHLLEARPGNLRCHGQCAAARAHSLVAARPERLVGPGVPRAARYQTRATPWPRRALGP